MGPTGPVPTVQKVVSRARGGNGVSDRVPEVCIQAGGWTGLSHWLISIVPVEKRGPARWGDLPR